MKEVYFKNTPYILNNNDFKTIQFKVIFPFKRNIEDIAHINMLPAMLHNLSMKYPTEELFSLECKKLYILNSFCLKSVFNDLAYYEFNMTVPDVEALRQDLLDEQISFFSEMIYNPYVIDNHFLDFEVERERKNFKKDIEKALNMGNTYHSIKLKELVDDNGYYSASIFNHQEQIDEVTPESLYSFYLDKVKNNQPIIFVMGNVNNKQINDLCNKYLYKEKYNNNNFSFNLYNYFTPRDTVNNIIEESNYKNSYISYAYKVKNMTIDDEVLLYVCRDLLSSLSSRLLNKKLRDDNDLVYSSFADCIQKYGLFIITASINKDMVDIVKDNIVEVVNDLRNEKLINPYLDKIKDRFRIGLIRRLDNKGSLFHEFVITELGIDISEEEFYNKLLKVTAKDISKFVDRLVLDTIYFLKEGDSFE